MSSTNDKQEEQHLPNGPALAAFLAAGTGGFAIGLFVIAKEIGVFASPSLYGPAGGVSGRTTFAAVAWLIAWAVLHRRWRHRELALHRAYVVALALTALGIVLCLPPVWQMLN